MLIVLEALEREHGTGRKGYMVRGMWSALIAGVLNQCRSLAEVVRLLEGCFPQTQMLAGALRVLATMGCRKEIQRGMGRRE